MKGVVMKGGARFAEFTAEEASPRETSLYSIGLLIQNLIKIVI